MLKTATSLLAAVVLTPCVFAGQEMKESKESKTTIAEPCFRDQELQLDLFASYTDSRGIHGDGFGGGLAVNYFFLRNVGVGVDGNIFDGDANGVWDATGRLIVRFPIEGSVCLAPYIFGGGGVMTDSTTVGTWHAGGGVEWRATHTFGIFAEGRYTWGADNQDAAQARLGVRFVF